MFFFYFVMCKSYRFRRYFAGIYIYLNKIGRELICYFPNPPAAKIITEMRLSSQLSRINIPSTRVLPLNEASLPRHVDCSTSVAEFKFNLILNFRQF